MDHLRKEAILQSGEFPGYTEGMIFPANKDQILDHARKQNMPPDVIDKLQRLPDKTYTNISDLITAAMKEVGE